MHLVLTLLLALACSAAAMGRELTLPVAAALQQAGLPAEALAFAALPLGHPATPTAWQGDRPMQPGSTMKVLTSIVALERLGPNHRGSTELLSSAPRQGPVLAGDLVLRGGGEVELGVPQLWALLMELREAGVAEIRGDIVLDRSRYSPPRSDIGQPPFDDAPEWPYNVIPDALNIAGSLLPLLLEERDGAVHARSLPALDGLVIDASALRVVDSRCADWDDHWKPATVQRVDSSTRVVLAGAFPRGCTARANLQLIDRDELADKLVRTLWRGLGGRWTGRLRDGQAAAGAVVLARRQGRPWGELLRPLNKGSDNAWTRVLFNEIGTPGQAGEEGLPTAERAARRLREWLAAQGIDTQSLVADNGSGLSRSERVSTRLLAQAIAAAWAGPHRHDLLMSLPTVGVDGTMRLRLRDSPASGWARLKTGTLKNVVGLAGVMRDGQGREWAVAMLINHEQAARGRAVLDALVDHWARTAPGAHAGADLLGGVGPLGQGP